MRGDDVNISCREARAPHDRCKAADDHEFHIFFEKNRTDSNWVEHCLLAFTFARR